MRVRLIAVGSRMPKWVREAYEDYITRLGSGLKVSLTEIDLGPRSAGRPPQKAMEVEGQKLLAAVRKDDYVIALDERGTEMTTRELATWLKSRMQDGRDLAFLVGGPDGFAPEVLTRSDFTWSLSRLTFPHALVRVVLAEQLYRAHGVLANHPYHRD
ncbi:MAG: rRNA ((1915)-N(3))-methyltransferase RlmH [Gammaproteobacteria bacterium]|jgi:23S rRNA (pseudouridine1915-N3)-methyltransferase|nr:rRNA ((1915)-N(3))-methyltransferase RlmH [Gammaproteobacteria bacterium]